MLVNAFFNKEADHWEWRQAAVDAMLDHFDMERFGVKALYLIGSVKTGTAGPCSDIDLLAHCHDDAVEHARLKAFMDGWGCFLAAINTLRTGLQTPGSLVDLHVITDVDILNKTSFGVMIDSHTNNARLLKKARKDE
jgi:pyruvate, water dikinase